MIWNSSKENENWITSESFMKMDIFLWVLLTIYDSHRRLKMKNWNWKKKKKWNFHSSESVNVKYECYKFNNTPILLEFNIFVL